MSSRASVAAFLLGLVVSLVVPAESRADEQQVLDRMVALNKSAINAFVAGDIEQAKSDLLEAVVMGKSNGLGLHAVMSRTYVHLGAIHTDGFKDPEKATRYYIMALKIRPDIEVTPTLASKTVAKAFGDAKVANGGAHVEKPDESATLVEDAAEPPEPKLTAKERKAQEAARKAEEAAARKEELAARKTEEAARKAEEANARKEDKRAQDDRAEKDKLVKELARDLQAAHEVEKKDRAEIEKLKSEKQDKDRQIADLKAQFDKEKKDKEKVLADLKAELAKDKQDLSKEKAEKDKLLAATKERERKEREAKDKQQQEKLALEAKERERKSKEEKERAERDKIAAGPDLPSHIPQKVYCPTADESLQGTEVFVHCVAQPNVNAKAAVLYYRTSGLAHFNSLVMSRSRKGWWMAAIPADKVTGRALQYYVEVRGGKDELAGTNGKAKLPNIMSLRPAAQKSAQ